MLHQLFYFAASCGGGNFLLFPPWYKYLSGVNDANGLCTPQMGSLSDIWLIVAAIIEILLRVAALAAVGYMIYGGFVYLTSQGEPDKTTQARKTITSALVGLVIAISSAAIVDFIAGNIS